MFTPWYISIQLGEHNGYAIASSNFCNWVTKYISPGDAAIARMDLEERIHGENGVGDVSAGTADAPGVGALAA
jgi:hypothetical protein